MSLVRPRKQVHQHEEHLGRGKWVLFCDWEWNFSDLLPSSARGEDLEYYQQHSKEQFHGEFTNGFWSLSKFGHSGAECEPTWWTWDDCLPFRWQTCSSIPFQLWRSLSLSKCVELFCVFLMASSASYLVVPASGSHWRQEPPWSQSWLPIFWNTFIQSSWDYT